MTLYELDYNLRAIDSLLAENQNEETTAILDEAKQQLQEAIKSKTVDIITYIQDCEAKVQYLAKEVDRINVKAKNLTARAKFLKNLLIDHLKSQELSKADYGTFTISLAKTPDKVVINAGEEQWLPDNLCTITRTPSKQAIKDAMVDGKLITNVDGHDIELAHLESSTTIRIK